MFVFGGWSRRLYYSNSRSVQADVPAPTLQLAPAESVSFRPGATSNTKRGREKPGPGGRDTGLDQLLFRPRPDAPGGWPTLALTPTACRTNPTTGRLSGPSGGCEIARNKARPRKP